MKFIEEILKYKTCSIVGLEKNTGKTECLNYILKNLPENFNCALTSIGLDGEKKDQLCFIPKPEIILREGTLFATSDLHYRQRKLVSEILQISDETSSLGRIITARVLSKGKIIISGPSTVQGLKRWMSQISLMNPDIVLIDGALSRLSSASPVVSESIVLATGAAYSVNMNTLLNKTAYIVELINLPPANKFDIESLSEIDSGLMIKTSEGKWINSNLPSALSIRNIEWSKTEKPTALYIGGAFTDSVLEAFNSESALKETEIIVGDFTKIFTDSVKYHAFIKNGRKISVLRKTKLAAVCVNPTSPSGYVLDSEKLCKALSESLKLPVYDLKKEL